MNSNLNSHHIALEIDKILERLSKFASCKLSSDECFNIECFNKKAQISYELSLVDEAKLILDNTQKSLPIEEIIDVVKVFNLSRLNPQEIIDTCNILKFSRLTKNFILKNQDNKNLSVVVQNLYVNKELEDEIFQTFDLELNVVDSASIKLKSLRNSYKDNKENLKIAISNLLQTPSFVENLQDTVVSKRDDRPVFQVKASCKNKISGIVHDVSSTNLTYFIEPSSLVPLTNKIKQIEIEINAEIDRILFSLTSKLKDIKNQLINNQTLLVKLDVIFAKAKFSINYKGVAADIVDEKIIDIQQMAHPLLLDIKKDVIKNDFILGKDFKCLLITGSNTGGKTVALKTVGLLVLMTKMGLHIPCLGAKIYPFEQIYCDISQEQSLEQGISTYSAHIKNISNILDNINSDSLVLLDELGSGTDPNEGAAISRAILEFISKKDSLSIVTTHLGELKALKYDNSYFENATVLFDVATLQPKYNLIIGMSGTSNAIDISSQLGLNSDIIERSRNILKNSSSFHSKMFLEIEKTNQNLIKHEQEARINLSCAKKTKEEYDDKLSELKKNKKKSLENFKKKFQTQLEEARSEIKKVVDEIRKEKSLKVAMRSYSRLNNIESLIREEFSCADEKLSEKFVELDINSLKIGQNVLIKKLNQVVILDSLPDKKGNVTVRIGNIKSKTKISHLAYTDKKVAPYLKKVQVSFDNNDNLLSRLDLRGMRVVEAIDYLDNKLDKASLRGLNQITVIHGFGTGALKQSVKDYLKTSPYVAKFRYADENEGRDGVVIVDLL